MTVKSARLFIAATPAIMLAFATASAFNPLPRVEPEQIYHALPMLPLTVTNDLALKLFGRPWQFSADNKCNFTYFSQAVKDVTFKAEGLHFATTGDEVVVGWGNYGNHQPRDERIAMFPGFNDVELVVRQSATASVWRVTLWMDGNEQGAYGNMGGDRAFELGGRSLHQVASASKLEATLTGTDRQTLRFRAFRGQPDGFGLRISGPANNHIVIEQVRITQVISGGVYRHVFALPPGRSIWRAVGEAGGVRLFLNGREVSFMPELFKDKGSDLTYPVDMAPYLQTGSVNVIAIDPADSALPYFQGRVVLDDGSIVTLATGSAWKSAMEAAPGWLAADFDDSSWQPAMLKPNAPYHFTHHLNRRWPVYDGAVLLENPGADPKLYYDDTAPICVYVRVPEGLAAEDAAVHWVLRRVERDNERPEAGRGIAAQWTVQGDTHSRICAVDLGQRDQGVYTLAAELRSGAKILASRLEEPLIVVGRLPMKEVAGDSYEEGMELELEDVIDFTDPNDPHRWTEAAAPLGDTKDGPAGARVLEPRIIRQNGLIYREVTDAGRAALFSYRLEFKHPFSWYMMVLEYPNDADRWIGVSVVTADRLYFGTVEPWRGPGRAQDAPSLVVGGKYPLDNTMREMRWLHWARPQIHALEIVNVQKTSRAAAARVRIYRVKELPAVKINTSGERFFGIHTERARMVALTFGDTSGLDFNQNYYYRLGYDMVAQFTQRLRWQVEAACNYTAYLRFTGENVHIMGAFQYNESNTAYSPPERVPGDGRILQDIREHALRYFERNGIIMYSLVEYFEHQALRRHFIASNEDIAAGADTLTFMSREGQPGGRSINPNHPLAEKGYLRVADELAMKFAFSPAWKGVYYNLTTTGEFGPAPFCPPKAPLDYDYSDASIARFEQDTKIKLPINPVDPNRFKKRYLYLTSDAMRAKWIEWRCHNVGSYLTKTRDLLRRYRSDLNVLCNWHIVSSYIRAWLDAGVPYGEYARQQGMCPSTVKDEPGIWFGRTIYPVGSSHGANYSSTWTHNLDPSVLAYYDMPNRMVTLNTCWFEYRTRLNDPDWPIEYKPNTLGLVAQAHDDNVWESYTQAIIGADPDILIFGFIDCPMITSREQHVREVARFLTPLPKAKFESVLGTADFRHNLAIRALSKHGDYWFYAANPCPWPVKGAVTLSGKASVIRPADGRAVETREVDGKTVVPLDLKAYGMAAFKAPASKVTVASLSNEPLPESALSHMRRLMREITALTDQREIALAITRADRDMIRGILAAAENHLAAGEYAAAWSELTDWRLWELWDKLKTAAKFTARLPDSPALLEVDEAGTWERPMLEVAAAKGAPPVIDGKLDDAAWKGARASFRFFSVAGAVYCGAPLVDMSVQACYDEDHIYIGMRMADPEVPALRKTASQANPLAVLRAYDDTVVMFFNADANRVDQFAVNAGGVKYYAGSGEWNVAQDDLRGVEWAAATGVAAGMWTVEVAVPFKALGVPAPQSGAQWRANFLRRFREFLIPESYWARVKKSWADVDCYGDLMFK